MNSLLSVLLVEDSLDDAELLVMELQKSGCSPLYKRVDTLTSFVAATGNLTGSDCDIEVSDYSNTEQWFLTHVQSLGIAIQYLGDDYTSRIDKRDYYDVVLLDLSLPDSAGLDTFTRLQHLAPDLPVVVLTGVDNRSLALEAMATGAQDYLVKGQFSGQLLERAIRYAIERKKAEVHVIKALEQERELNQLKLIHTEKMATLGQLVASVAHEINNPVNFIFANLIHVDNYTRDVFALIDLYEQVYIHTEPTIQGKIEEIDFDFLKEDLPKIISSMKIGAERICELVLTLRNFSRLDAAEMQPVNIHEGIDSTLLILQDRLKEKLGRPAIQIIKEYGNLPLVECYAGQLNQVFMNILSNAIDALSQAGLQEVTAANYHNFPSITIRTQILDSNRVGISIKDNGPGMTESVKEKLFEPFFTTKKVGKGTGLGLSISYQIVVEKHGGQLQCISALEHGAEFIVVIPIRQKIQS